MGKCKQSSVFILILILHLSIPPAISHPPRLSQHCSGVVEVLHRGLWRPVTFDLGSAEWAKVVEDICTNLSCGAVYERRQNGTATLNYSSSTCLSQCVYRDLLVENCTELSYTDCSNLTEITCGKTVIAKLMLGSASILSNHKHVVAVTPANCMQWRTIVWMALQVFCGRFATSSSFQRDSIFKLLFNDE